MVRDKKAAPDAVTQWAKDRIPFLFGVETRETFFIRISRFLPELDPNYKRIEMAYDDAEAAFRGKMRDGGGNYFEGHLLLVALIVVDYLEIRDPEIIIAALLHDILEDTEWTVERLRSRYGDRVALLVYYATEPTAEEFGSKEAAELVYHNRFGSATRDFFLVKLPDRLHNLITLGARPRDKQIAKAEETELHYMRYAREHLILLPELREVLQLWRKQFAQA